MKAFRTSNRGNPNRFIARIRQFLFPGLGTCDSAALNLEGNKGVTGRNIVTISTQDWHDLWTRKQRFMLQFARQGNKVLYVETQFHWLTYFKTLRSQWRRIYLFLLGPRKVEPNLYVYTPPLLLPAFQIFPKIGVVNNSILAIFLKAAMRKVEIKNPLLWLYSHYNQPLVRKLSAKRALYECVDEYSAARGLVRADVVKEQEAATLREVDAAIVTAPRLKATKTGLNRSIYIVPNASNVAHFTRALSDQPAEPDDLKNVIHPRLIFIGATAYWIDLDLLHHIACSRPDWQLVMVGPVSLDVGRLKRLQNIHFLGRKPFDILPGYLAWSDIAINPYKIGDVAANCSPLKLYEYLAAGLPIVSTTMAEASAFPGLIRTADTCDEFLQHIETILKWSNRRREAHMARSRKESQNHTWEKRFLEVERIVMEIMR